MNEKLRELPSNIEAEQGLLGAILIDNRTFDRVASFLDEEHFFEPLHQRIYLVCRELIQHGQGGNADHGQVRSCRPNAKIGDMTMVQYLTTLAVAAVGTITARDFGIAVHEAWLAREAISLRPRSLISPTIRRPASTSSASAPTSKTGWPSCAACASRRQPPRRRPQLHRQHGGDQGARRR
jgi:hypothetical protein